MSLSSNDKTNHLVFEDSNETQPNSSRNNEPGVKTLQKNWSCMDPLVVGHIYSFLNKTDQFHMSLVCKNWLKEFESPHLWQNYTFYLPEYVCPCETCPGIKFPQKFVRFFKNVEIVCKRVRSNLINDIFIQLLEFLDLVIDESQLHSIRFLDMNKYFKQLEDDDYSLMIQRTLDFFDKQKNLELLEFRDSLFLQEEGVKLLKSALENNARTLKTVVIKGFVTNSIEFEDLEVEDFELYCSMKRRIINLNTLRTDYNQLFENIIMARSKEPEEIGRLSLLELICDGSKRHRYQGVSPQAWQCLRRLCPNLTVQMILTSPFHPRDDFSFYIVRNMPIHLLEYHVPTHLESGNVYMEELFQHLVHCGSHHHLENLALFWMPRVEDVSIPLVPFLQVARKLKRLYIYVRSPINGIKDLFLAWLIKRPCNLEMVYISVAQVDTEEYFQYLVRLSCEYSPLLKILGLEINLIAHPV